MRAGARYPSEEAVLPPRTPSLRGHRKRCTARLPPFWAGTTSRPPHRRPAGPPAELRDYKTSNLPTDVPRVCADAVMGLVRSYHAQCAASRSGHALSNARGMCRALKRAVSAVRWRTRAPMWPGEAASSVGSRTLPNTFLWPVMIDKGSGWVARPTQHPYSAHHVMLPSANMRQRRDMHKHAAAS